MCLDLQFISGRDSEGSANRFRKDKPAGLVDGDDGIHEWIMPLFGTILDRSWGALGLRQEALKLANRSVRSGQTSYHPGEYMTMGRREYGLEGRTVDCVVVFGLIV
jgi:hypothetical protein